jgi:hypothetical protein
MRADGYLTFLKSLTEYQQRAEIAHLAFNSGCLCGSALEEEILKEQAVSAFSEKLGVNPGSWKLDLKHYAEEPELFEPPVFQGEQCVTPFWFLYRHLKRKRNLVVTGAVYADDDGKAKIAICGCDTPPSYQSHSRARLIFAGIDPETLETVSHNTQMSLFLPYLDYLKALMPQQQRDAIFDLSKRAWGTDNPKFLDHPKLAPELERLGISDLIEADLCHQVGPVNFKEGRLTAPVTYYLYGDGERESDLGYYVEVHILAGIDNKPDGGGEISVVDTWMRTVFIDDPEDDSILVLTH